MWESKESVYELIKPPAIKKPRTPPPTAREVEVWGWKVMQRERKLAKIMLRMKEMMSERAAATFGYSPGTLKPLPTNFLKKHSTERIIAYGVDRCSVKAKVKPDIPTEPPKYGLGGNQDWIKVNAVKVIKTKANKTGCPKKKRRYVTKKNYGKLPLYLETRIRTAAEIKKRDSPEEQAKCRHDGTRKLDEKERMEMVNNLKLKWAHTNAAYQKLSFVLDTNSKKLRKERFERNLTNIEKDVALLCRKVVLVSDSAPAKIRQESTGSMH